MICIIDAVVDTKTDFDGLKLIRIECNMVGRGEMHSTQALASHSL